MSNPIFQALNGGRPQQGPQDMMQNFQRFMRQFQGQDPTKILNDLISSGKVSQRQLDIAQRQAQQMRHMFADAEKMFKS